MNAPDDTPAQASVAIDELANHLRTVQDQIGQLELAAKEKKKPWWKQTSLLISMISLAISASFSFYTAFNQAAQSKHEAEKQRAAALETTLSDIVALRLEDTKQAVALASTNVAAYRAWTSTAVVKRAMLIDAAMNEIQSLNGKLAPIPALEIGNELIIDGRYGDAERILTTGVTAAEAAKTSTPALLSALAQVYLFPGSPLYDQKKGRELYWRAINAYPNQTDYNTLTNKLNLILTWAANEHGFKNQQASDDLLRLATKTVKECTLPEAAKTPQQALVDGTQAQLKLQSSTLTLFDVSKLAGSWRTTEPDGESSELIFISGAGSAFPNFTKNRVSGGKLSERINGIAVILGQDRMRLDWSNAVDTGPSGPFQTTGYSEVTLQKDERLHGTDFAFGLAPKKWTARKQTH